MKHWIAAAFLLSPLLPVTSYGQDRGSASDQDACRPDVFRLCAEAIPDEDRIVACLQSRVAELGAPCRNVIDPAPAQPKLRPRPVAGRRS